MKRAYTGYLREAYTYLTYPFSPKRSPAQKFFIFTTGRSGSNLLVSLLNSHPLIQCNSELLLKRVLKPELYLACHERLSRKDVYGFKLLSIHLEIQHIRDPKGFIDRLCSSGYQIISLKRRNIVRQSISHLYASYRGKFHHLQDQGEQVFVPMRLEPEQLFQELQLLERLNALGDQLLADRPYLSLFYEDDLSDAARQQGTVDRISEFLGIPPAKLGTSLVKTTPEDLSVIIENFAEIRDCLAGTPYGSYLNR
jgi:hypothetical protein